MTINGHIEHLLEKHEKMMRAVQDYTAFPDGPSSAEAKENFMQRFSVYTHQKLLTQYCQERLLMFNRYSIGHIFSHLQAPDQSAIQE